MPKGWKIELLDNLSKIDSSTSKHQTLIKRPRSSNIIKDFSDEEEESVKKKKTKKNDQDYISKEDSITSHNNSLKNNKSLREKKPNIMIKELDNLETEKKIKPSPNQEISKKCEKVFTKLRKHPLSDYFFTASNEKFSLTFIEKNIKTNSYSSCFQFGMEIRAVWNHHFSKAQINSDIYQKTFTLSNYFEEIFKDIENLTLVNEEKTEMQELTKKVTKLQEKFNKVTAPANNVKRERSYSTSEKPMSTIEKTQLGNNIKKLSHEQLRGIIKIVSDSVSVEQNSKYFEFDIETLQPKKLRELDKYVKNCLKVKTTQVPQLASHSSEQVGSKDSDTFVKNTSTVNANCANANLISNKLSNASVNKTISQLNTANNTKVDNKPVVSNNTSANNNHNSLKRPSKKPLDDDSHKFESPSVILSLI